MNEDMSILSAVELYLPLSMLKEALLHVERNEYTAFQSTCILPTLQQQVNITATKSERHFKIHIDKLCFLLRNGVHECILNSMGYSVCSDVDNDTQRVNNNFNDCVDFKVDDTCRSNIKSVSDLQNRQTQGTEDAPKTIMQVKRKRGRPRKSESQKKIEETRTQSRPSLDQEEHLSAIDKTVDSVSADQCDANATRRYSLRGKKLNLRLMAVEKGSEWSDEDDVTNNTSDVDVDFSPSHENESDDEARIKSQTRTVKKNVHENLWDSKENVEVNHSRKRINEEIIAILSESNCALLSNVKQYVEVSCKICDKLFQHASKLFTHVENQHSSSEESSQYLKELNDLKMLVCGVCSEKFEDSTAFRTHLMEQHQQKIDMKCPRCEYTAKNLPSLKIHVRNMHLEVGIKRAFCHLCTASFRSHGSLKQHIDLNHLGNKHVQCGTCNKKFYNSSQLRRHSRIHGLDLSKRSFCKVCNKSFMFEYNLKRHMGAVHQTQTESFHCSYCGKGFSQKTPMISHVQLVHFNLFPYSCKVCKCSFPRASMLKEHMMCIHEQPDYQVPVMPKNSLYDKTDDDKFYCSYCSTGFVHKIRLIEHMHKDHADAFPYKCDICVQGFLEKSFLAHHSVKVHGILLPAEEAEKSESAGQIMQVITTRSGCPSKIMQTVEIQNSENVAEDGELTVHSSSQDETVTAPDAIQTPQSKATSLLVEVDSGNSTYRYVIEAPKSMGQLGSEAMVQDIANILLAAKQNTPEEWNEEEYAGDSTPVQEVNLIINENNDTVVNELDSREQEQTVEVTYGQSVENVHIVRTDNDQELPMEVVIDQNEENCITFAVESQAEPLNVANGDIIELNDKSDGTNYYRIINVVDNVDEIEQVNSD